MILITREEAKARGLKRYFTGKACKHGHVAERLLSGGHCVVCHSAKPMTEAKRKRKQNAKSRKRKFRRDAVMAADNLAKITGVRHIVATTMDADTGKKTFHVVRNDVDKLQD